MVSRSQRVCLLCEFPAAESAVRLADVDAEKWTEWCRRTLDTDFDIVSDAEVCKYVCQFCIWDARLAHEGSLDDCRDSEKEFDWWTGHDDDHFFREYYYKKPVFRPCNVVLQKISSEFDHLSIEDIAVKDCHHSNSHLKGKIQACQTSTQVEKQSDIKSADGKSTTKIFQCSICEIIFSYNSNLTRHIKSIHKNVVRCRSFHCTTYFFTEDERKQHEQKFHLTGPYIKMVKCIYCGALLTSKKLCKHIKTQHKEAIKCDYNIRCANYFQTESEKNEHIFNEHTRGLQLKNTPVKCIYCNKIYKSIHKMQRHADNSHIDVSIKCRAFGCVVFFLSEKEREEHFLQVHQNAESLKKWHCLKCSYKSKRKHQLRTHLQNVHSNKAKMKCIIFKCSQCPKYFITKLNLRDHIKNIHAERCTCQYCGKTMQKASMTEHFLGEAACKPIPT